MTLSLPPLSASNLDIHLMVSEEGGRGGEGRRGGKMRGKRGIRVRKHESCTECSLFVNRRHRILWGRLKPRVLKLGRLLLQVPGV